jgi:transposase
LHLDHIDHLDAAIATLDGRVDELIRPFAQIRELLMSIPGVGQRVAEVTIAEIGVDMGVFASDAHLASWAAVCPGNNASAGKHYSGRTRKGNEWLTDALLQAPGPLPVPRTTIWPRSFGGWRVVSVRRRLRSRWRTRFW